MTVWGQGFKITIKCEGVEILAERKCGLSFSFSIPNCQFNVNRRIKCLSFGNFKFSFGGVNDFVVERQGDEFVCRLEFNERAKVRFCEGLRNFSAEEILKFKKENFGVVDFSKIDIKPSFKKKMNEISAGVIGNYLSVQNREIVMPKKPFCEVRVSKIFEFYEFCYIDIEHLGFSRLVNTRYYNSFVVLRDELVNFEYRFKVSGRVNAKILSYFGRMYLFLEGEGVISVECLPFGKDFGEVILGEEMTFLQVLEQMNVVFLQGNGAQDFKFFREVRFWWLPSFLRFVFINTLMSYVSVFCDFKMLKREEVRQAVVECLGFAVKNFDERGYCYIKKVLPLIKSKKLYNEILYFIFENRGKFLGWYPEYVLSEKLGLRLFGSKMSLRPSKDFDFSKKLILRGKEINLVVRKDWQNVRVGKLGLKNVDSFDLNSLDCGAVINYE